MSHRFVILRRIDLYELFFHLASRAVGVMVAIAQPVIIPCPPQILLTPNSGRFTEFMMVVKVLESRSTDSN
jgi:hypothetical protein